jgi:hypothetical protein
MARSIWAFINRVARSHLGHVLLAVSWTFVLLVFVRRHPSQPQFVDCVPADGEFIAIVDKFYPISTVVLEVAHLPAIFFAWAATKLLQISFSISCEPTAKLEIVFLFMFSAVQWLLVGYIIESFVRKARSRK